MMENDPVPESQREGRAALPAREFMYTLDQVADILNIQVESLRRYVYFRGIDRNLVREQDAMVAISITPSALHKRAEWRIPETEFLAFLKKRGLTVYERAYQPRPDSET
jgi:hypothetical protein